MTKKLDMSEEGLKQMKQDWEELVEKGFIDPEDKLEE
jgi:hypothetical protein